MAGHTIVNLKEIEDMAVRFGMSPDLEARFARVPLECEKLGLSYFHYAPGVRASFGHRHREQEEVYVLVFGSARMRLDDEIVELRQWDAVRLPPETMRAIEAGPAGVELIALSAPNTGPGDAEMVQGWWQ